MAKDKSGVTDKQQKLCTRTVDIRKNVIHDHANKAS